METQNPVHLSILTQNDVFGMDEILQNVNYRQQSVQCISRTGQCYFLSKDNFFHCVNQFKFHNSVVQERMIKHNTYCDRVQ